MPFRLCTLSLSVLLCLPVLAETPKPAPLPPPAAPSAAYHWQKLTLNHIIPADALVALRWDTPTATLPAGVERVYPLQTNNSLLLKATDAGFAEATRLVQTVDLPPAAKPAAVPQVLLRVEYAIVDVNKANRLVPASPSIKMEVQCLNGETSDKIHNSLIRSPGSLSQCPPAIAASNRDAYFNINTNPFGGLPALPPPSFYPVRVEAALLVAPRINQDSSITLIFNALASVKGTTVVYWPRLPVTRTVRSGERLLLISLPIQQSDTATAYKVFMFVTPTVLGSKAAAVDTGQPDPPMPGITDTPAEAKRFATVDVSNADMATVVAMLQRQTGLSISLRVGGEPFRNVSVHLEHATPSQVLRAVARSAGAVLTRKADGEYIFAMPTAAPSAEIAPLRLLTSPVYRLHGILVKHVRASDILTTMHWGAEHQTPFSPLEEIPPPRRFAFPTGVRQVFVVDETNMLFADATDQGFAEITRAVKALDHGPQAIEFNTLLLAVPTSRRGLDPATQDTAKFLTTLLSGTKRLVWAVPVTAEGGQDVAVSVGGRPVPPGFRLSTQRNLDGTLTLRPAFDGISPLPAHTVLPGKAAVWEVPNQPLVTGERLFFFVRPTLRPATVESGETITVTP